MERLSADQLGDMLGYPTKAGIAVRDEDFAQLQPFALARGFAQSIMWSGAKLYERTPVRRFDLKRNEVELTTENGFKVTAGKLVLAIGARIRELGWGRFRIFPNAIHSCMIAPEPLDDVTLARLVSSGGIGGNEGALILLLEGYKENLDKAVGLVEGVKGEPGIEVPVHQLS